MNRQFQVLFVLLFITVLSSRVQAAPTAFDGSIVLGCPTTSSVKTSVFSPDQNGTLTIGYGTGTGTYVYQTAAATLVAGTPQIIVLNGLAANTQYYYRLNFQVAGQSGYTYSSEHTFHTARPADSTFTFSIQADSHLDEESDLNLYRLNLANIAADVPDFHLDLGDTFMCEKHSAPFTALVQPAPDAATVNARYVYERANFGLIAHSLPLFLINGNHEGEAGWLNDGTANNLAVWTTLARHQFFPNPVPDGYYSGDTVEDPTVGKRASWFAWQWGNALFVVLDPFWETRIPPTNDAWNMTLGSRQYQWLQQTLATSTATFKLVFIHDLVGGLDGQMRGGTAAAPYYEWGGRNSNGSAGFAQMRAGWAMPIHQLLVQYGVTAVFHGHDHLYDKQTLDGVLYQEVPQPGCINSQNGPGLATDYHYSSGTILSSSGHLRVTVGPHHVTSQYILLRTAAP